MPSSPSEVCCRVPPAHPGEEWRERGQQEGWQDAWECPAALDEGVLPSDPRQWSRAHVQLWLLRTAARHGLAVRTSRFLMNGKALCLMSAGMYEHRVPAGGALLHRDFRRRLARALQCP